MDWFPYDRDLHHERVDQVVNTAGMICRACCVVCCYNVVPVSNADNGVVNLIVISILFANWPSTFFINSNPTFINGSRSLPRNPSDSIILDI